MTLSWTNVCLISNLVLDIFDFGSWKVKKNGRENKIIQKPVIGKLILIFSKVDISKEKIGSFGNKNIP